MDKQAVLMLALATLFVAGIVVGVCGWMLFVRSKPSAGEDEAGSSGEPGDLNSARERHPEPDVS